MNAKRYKTFDEMQLVFTNYVRDAANMARLGIAAVTAEQLVAFYNQWTAIYYQYIDPEQRTRPVTREIYRIYLAYGKYIRRVRQEIKTHNRDKLTADDRVNLDIPVDADKHHLVRPPADAFILVAYKFAPRVAYLKVEFADGATRLHRHNIIQINYAVIAQDATVTDSDYLRYKESTRLKFHLDFDAADRQKVCYMHGCIATRRGLKSPMSDTINFIIL